MPTQPIRTLKIFNKILFILLLTLNCISTSANQHISTSTPGDTTKQKAISPNTTFFTADNFGNSDSSQLINSELTDIQNYLPHHHLGNSGTAMNHAGSQFWAKPIGFHYSSNNFRDYFFTRENLLFYDTHTPYSDLLYVMGSKKESNFRLTFSYNVKKNWNITANFMRIRSEGTYLRQSTNDNFLSFSTVYKSKHNRYSVLGGILFNYVQNLENGGIVNDTLFEEGGNLDKQLLDVNLSAARSAYRNRSVFVDQYINFGKKSDDTTGNGQIVPNSRLKLATIFDDVVLRYVDDKPYEGFYADIFYDSIRTYDSTYNVKFENELSWKRVDNGKHRGFVDKLGVGLRAKDQFIFTRQYTTDTTFNNILAGGEIFNTYSDHKLWFNLNGDFCLSGYNEGDYAFKGAIKKGILDSLTSLTFSASASQHQPDYIYSTYTSNHFEWNDTLDKITENNLSLNYSMKKYRLALSVNYKEITDPVYFDNYALARQYKGTISVITAGLKKDFTFFNWHLNNNIQYNYVPDSVVIRLPQYVLQHSLFYENDVFKHAAHIQIGASVLFASAYFADKYMPATQQFYIQDNKKYGNYPFIDFFLNAKIKNVRIFFKIDHLNSGWMGNKYMMTSDMPWSDRTFKLGVSWRFFD